MLDEPAIGTTVAGAFKSTTGARLEECLLPKFSRSKKIDCVNAVVFDAPDSQCDVTLGRDCLLHLEMDPMFSTKKTRWMDHTLDMKPPGFWENPMNLCPSSHVDVDEDEVADEDDECTTEIKHAKCKKVDAMEVVRQQKHLNEAQQALLGKVPSKCTKLFDGTLGKHPHRKAHLELDPNAVPVHSKPHAVPKTHKQAFTDELEHLCAIGVLEQCGATEWAAPTFIVPKKDGRARWVSDFRTLNQMIKRKTRPLPRTQDVLSKRKGH
jgi:hypothetical protein